MIIKPTPGRVVHYHSKILQHDPAQPLAAHVAFVWSDRLVNLRVITPDGSAVQRVKAILLQEGDPVPEGDPTPEYATWMPYQTAVAKGEVAAKVHA